MNSHERFSAGLALLLQKALERIPENERQNIKASDREIEDFFRGGNNNLLLLMVDDPGMSFEKCTRARLKSWPDKKAAGRKMYL